MLKSLNPVKLYRDHVLAAAMTSVASLLREGMAPEQAVKSVCGNRRWLEKRLAPVADIDAAKRAE